MDMWSFFKNKPERNLEQVRLIIFGEINVIQHVFGQELGQGKKV